MTGGRGVELVLDFVGTDQTHSEGVAMLARAGTYSVVSYGGTLSMPSASMVVNEHAVSATWWGPGRTCGSCCGCTAVAG